MHAARRRRVHAGVFQWHRKTPVEVIDVLLPAFPQHGVRVCADMLRMIMYKINKASESVVVMRQYMGLIERELLLNIGHMESKNFRGNGMVCVKELDVLLEHFDTMLRLPRRQIGALAVMGLRGRYLSSEQVLKHIAGLLKSLVQVLREERRKDVKQRAEDNTRNGETEFDQSGDGGGGGNDGSGDSNPIRQN